MKQLLLIAVLSLIACDGLNYDLESASLWTFTEDMPSNVDVGPADGSTPDMVISDAELDTTVTDTGDTSVEPDVFVSKCEFPAPVDPARCNPTTTGVCPGEGFCTLAVAAAPPPELLCVMRDLEGTGDVGAPCSRVSDCREGQTCVDWGLQEADPRPKGCTKYCEIESGLGCDADEFCTTAQAQPPLEGIGWCTPTCDPYNPDSCPTGQTCNVDYNYPVGTCEAHFRCVEVEDSVAEGEACGPGRMVASCDEDLVCYEVQIADFVCVSPCSSAADCTNGDCLPPAGPWQLRFCAN